MSKTGHLTHGKYWEVAPGQLERNELVLYGCTTEPTAQKKLLETQAKPRQVLYVRQLATIEHELAADHPEYHQQAFTSKRWCVILKEEMIPVK